jgi:TolB-like protein
MHMGSLLKPSFVRLALVIYLTSLVVPTALSQQKRTPSSQQKINIAVLDFDARGGISREEAASLSDIFQSKLVEFGEFNVVDRNRIKTILQEQGFQQSEVCSQVECIVEAGRILKVERMFAGTIGKVGRVYNVNIQLIDIATSQIVQNKSRQHSGDVDELATVIIQEMAKEMVEGMVGKEMQVTTTSKSSSSWIWYVGGAVVVGGAAAAVLLLKKTDGTTDSTPLPASPEFP